MVVNSFPAPPKSESGKCQVTSNFGKKNIIVNAKARQIEYNNLLSPLTLKYTFKGSEWYNVHGREVLVENSSFLLINDEQRYSTHIDSDVEVESFCIFFRDDLIRELYTHHTSSLDQLVNDPEILKDFHIEIVEKRFAMDASLFAILKDLRSKKLMDDIEEEHHIYAIIERLLGHQIDAKAAILELPNSRVSTKMELYRRIHLAKDYIDSCISEALDLQQLSGIANLSKYHFLRIFKAVFGLPPHQYIIRKRLEKASQLLKQGASVSDTCLDVGFSSTSSFCRLFKAHFGTTPANLATLAN
ncbi:MAG: AraC family transcriptional regulator [Bacteroidota bacterium]